MKSCHSKTQSSKRIRTNGRNWKSCTHFGIKTKGTLVYSTDKYIPRITKEETQRLVYNI